MADSGAIFREVRFIIKDNFTECYVAIDATGDAPLGVQGWHYKVFEPTQNCKDILDTFVEESPVLWAQKAP